MKLITHSLLATTTISSGDPKNPHDISNISQRMKDVGSTGLEVAYHPGLFTATVNDAVASRSAHIPIRALCVIFGGGDPDPLSGGREECLARLKDAILWAAEYGKQTGETPQITGPWSFRIATQYSRTASCITGHSIEFIKRARDLGVEHGVQMNLEYLRPVEGFAIQGPEHCFEIVSSDTSGTVRMHEDTFHAALWGTTTSQNIEKFSSKIGWLHTSGTNRHTPGHPSDRTDWSKIGTAIDVTRWNGSVCFEGFGPEFRREVPEIAEGFPQDLRIEAAVPLAIVTLRESGIIE